MAKREKQSKVSKLEQMIEELQEKIDNVDDQKTELQNSTYEYHGDVTAWRYRQKYAEDILKGNISEEDKDSVQLLLNQANIFLESSEQRVKETSERINELNAQNQKMKKALAPLEDIINKERAREEIRSLTRLNYLTPALEGQDSKESRAIERLVADAQAMAEVKAL